MKFKVKSTEISEKIVEVEAISVEAAAAKVEADWKNGIHILNAEDYKRVDFSADEVILKRQRRAVPPLFSER